MSTTVVARTPTPELGRSLDFYRRLGFTVVHPGDGAGGAEVVVSDGQVAVVVDPRRHARAGVTLYGDAWGEVAKTLAERTPVHAVDGGYLLSDGAGCWIGLHEGPFDLGEAARAAPPSRAGRFAGLSLEAPDLDATLAIWQTLGFAVTMGDPAGPYVSLADAGGFTVSLMRPLNCPHLFFNPSLTYFNGGRNLEVIADLRAAGVPITEEVTCFNDEGVVDNVILRDPGGYGIFVFND